MLEDFQGVSVLQTNRADCILAYRGMVLSPSIFIPGPENGEVRLWSPDGKLLDANRYYYRAPWPPARSCADALPDIICCAT